MAPADDDAGDGGPPDDAFGDFGVPFVVAGQPAAGGEPGQSPLDEPAAGDDGEALLVWGYSRMLLKVQT
jgi:hypothetical protein